MGQLGRVITGWGALALLWGTLAMGPLAQATCGESAGRTERQTYRSTLASTQMYVTVYLPPCYDADASTPYPVVYLMHGSASYDDHWVQVGLTSALDAAIADEAVPPMVAVLPYGEWMANRNTFDAMSWEQVFLRETMPAVEAQYRVATDRAGRAIGGISRGGFWALSIAFRHPHMFAAVGAHSAYMDLYHAPPEHNPLHLAVDAPGVETLVIAVDRGRDDYARDGMDTLHERLVARGVQHIYTVHPEGQHDIRVWRAHVGAYVRFYGAALRAADASHAMPIPSAISTVDPASFVFTPPRVATTPTPALTPTPMPMPAHNDQSNPQAVYRVVPVAAFNSLLTSISRAQLDTLWAGAYDPHLVMTQEAIDALARRGVLLSAATTVVAPEALVASLGRDQRRAYSLVPWDVLTPRLRPLWVDDVPATALEDDPLAFLDDSAPNFDPSKLTRVTLSGVTALTRLTRQAIDARDPAWAASGIAPYAAYADFMHSSNEVSFSDECPNPPSGEPVLGAFCARTAHFDVLPLAGVNVVELSGNHNNDWGYQAYHDTLALYRAAGMLTVGGGADQDAARQPLWLEHNGNRIAWVACNTPGPFYAVASAPGEAPGRPGTTYCDWDWLRAMLPGLAAESDLLIVTVQYLEEEDYAPLPQQQRDFRGFADLGADVVVGTQAHKPQYFAFHPAEGGRTALLHYGLGNLFFDQPFWGNSRFFMDTLLIYDGRLVGVELFPGIIDDLARPRLMTPEERENFLGFMFMNNPGVQF